jgi:putative transposase
MIKDRPLRLDEIFQAYDLPLFFVTICTIHRQKIADLETVHQAFRKYVGRALNEFGVAVGRYVIMPDHMHFFVRGSVDFELARWINGLKRSISIAMGATNDESYGQKWEYVQENPVRAGLVKRADEWPHQGEFTAIDRA